MFGESESESPRVPSPWDSLISASPSPVPKSRAHTPSPLAAELANIPRLVPESDDGNVEYKLQLLNPTPARFARLVTQLKWRLLEGGGQAYYELGVADSGDLVGLPRAELEQSVETLEMMAGEIGASVIVVKEIEVPAALARLAKRSGDSRRKDNDDDDSYSSGTALYSLSYSDVDLTDEGEKESSAGLYPPLFSMDSESDTDSGSASRFSIDLEIATVFKPRPVRTKHSFHPHHPLVGGKNKRNKKQKALPTTAAELAPVDKPSKAHNRRQTRDRKREEKKMTLLALAAQAVGEDIPAPIPTAAEESIVSALENLELSVEDPASSPTVIVESVTAVVAESVPLISVVDEGEDDDDDVFPTTAKQAPYPKFASAVLAESHLDVDPAAVKLAGALEIGSLPVDDDQPRLIVEALVVRKMSLEEGFLDFGGFAII